MDYQFQINHLIISEIPCQKPKAFKERLEETGFRNSNTKRVVLLIRGESPPPQRSFMP